MSCTNCGNKENLTNRLSKRVAVLRLPGPDDVDDYGQPTEGYIEVTKLWAGIEPLQGREFFAAKAENAEVTTRIRIRYREGIDRTMIVRYKTTEFEVLYTINPKFENKELQLMCKERQ